MNYSLNIIKKIKKNYNIKKCINSIVNNIVINEDSILININKNLIITSDKTIIFLSNNDLILKTKNGNIHLNPNVDIDKIEKLKFNDVFKISNLTSIK